MPSAQNGTAGTLVSPTAPTDSTNACDATWGAVESVDPSQRTSYSGTLGSTQVDPYQSSPQQSTPDQQTPPPPKPTIAAKWSKPEITVDHNSSWPPAKPPLDTVPEEAKVDLIVTTTNVPDGTGASISIYSVATGQSVSDVHFGDLQVTGGQVIDKSTGKAPQWAALSNMDWQPWNKPLFYFQATVAYQDLSATTPQTEAGALRLLYWHMSLSDAIADSPAGGGLTTGAEMVEIAGILTGVPHHHVGQQAVKQANVPVPLWASLLRNTFAYHHASHGDVVDRTTGAQLNDGNNNPPTVAVGNWRSVVVLGSTNLGDAEITQAATVTAPRFLAYLDTCVAGWEPSFGNAILARGTRNVVAFRCYIPDGDARTMARNFYKKWCTTYQCDPSKIPDVFFDAGSPYYTSMRPVLFGKGGGAIQSTAGRIATAVGRTVSGIAQSIGNLF